MLRPLALCLTLGLLPGCAAVSALSGGAPTQGYELRAAPSVKAARTRDLQLVVEVPEAAGSLRTDRLLIRPTAIQASYLPEAQWTDEVPLMVQTVMVQALTATNGYTYVGREPLGLSGDYALLTELTAFEAELTPTDAADAGGAASVRAKIALTARIVREADARVVATRAFDAQTTAAGDSADAVAAALHDSLNRVMPDLSAWVLQKTGVGTAR